MCTIAAYKTWATQQMPQLVAEVQRWGSRDSTVMVMGKKKTNKSACDFFPQKQTEDLRTLYCCYLKKEMENRDQEMAYRALKMRKLEKEILLLDKQLMWRWNCKYFLSSLYNIYENNVRSDSSQEIFHSLVALIDAFEWRVLAAVNVSYSSTVSLVELNENVSDP